jgi:hypothetical protein
MDRSERLTGNADTALERCRACPSRLMQPVQWRRLGDDLWEIDLRCPDRAEALGSTSSPRAAVSCQRAEPDWALPTVHGVPSRHERRQHSTGRDRHETERAESSRAVAEDTDAERRGDHQSEGGDRTDRDGAELRQRP